MCRYFKLSRQAVREKERKLAVTNATLKQYETSEWLLANLIACV